MGEKKRKLAYMARVGREEYARHVVTTAFKPPVDAVPVNDQEAARRAYEKRSDAAKRAAATRKRNAELGRITGAGKT